ncbi:MAG: hypothetical protein LBT25_05605, partial [Candidatus Symbiothrix sp.]|nr:hypothetical protein [Candidatus Symbiothrix sp.]
MKTSGRGTDKKKEADSQVQGPGENASYTEKVSYNLQRQQEIMTQPVDNAAKQIAAINSNPEASAEAKAAATVVVAAEAAIGMAGNLMGLGMKVSESLMMPVMEKLSFL